MDVVPGTSPGAIARVGGCSQARRGGPAPSACGAGVAGGARQLAFDARPTGLLSRQNGIFVAPPLDFLL
jgi:hypothetical protein